MSAARRHRDRFLHWWLNDLPPLSGPLRFLFYAGLLVTIFANVANPVRGIVPYEATDPRLFRTYGLVELLGVGYLPPEMVRAIIAITVVAWISAAVGFLSRKSAVLTAAGIVTLHGLFLGTNSLNHNWFLPMYAVVALCFARTNDRWSIDHYVNKWSGRGFAGEPARATLADTGFARKLILVMASLFYFSAGFTKLVTSGLTWADGHAIAYVAEQRRGSYPLAGFVADNPEVSAILSILTLIFELGAITMLVSRRARWVIIPGLMAMHAGIRLSVGPAYWENILVLSLLLDWRAPGEWLGARVRVLDGWLQRAAGAIGGVLPRASGGSWPRGARVGAAGGTAVLLLFGAAALFQVFWWPLTNVYMYSSYSSIPRDIRANHPRAAYERVESAQSIARSFVESPPSMVAIEYFVYRIRLRLASSCSEPLYLTENLGVSRWKQWVLTVGGPVLIRDLAAKPTGRIEFDPQRPDFPAQRFLLEIAPVLGDHLPRDVRSEYDRVELTYPLGRREVVIASASISETELPLAGLGRAPARCTKARVVRGFL